jgi:hypothetical protein
VRFVLHRRPVGRRRNRNWIAKGKTHALVATAIATAAPSVGAPAISQTHALAAMAIASGAPSTGAPAMEQTHALAAMDIAAGAPIVGAPELGGTAAPVVIEAEGFDLPRTERRRVYELGLRADLEKAERTLQEAQTRLPWEAPGEARQRGDEGLNGSQTWPPWFPPQFLSAQALIATGEGEEDDEDVVLLAL